MHSLLCLLALTTAQPPIPGPVPVPPESVRKILTGLVESAESIRRIPGAAPPSDEITAILIRRAATEALKLPKDERAPAFGLALAIGLDDSEILRNNFLLGRTIRAIESDAQRKTRLAVLGSPSLQSRRDWCQHFAVSVGLVVLGGSDASRAAGILKEHLDSRPGGSGFSLADLAANEGGIRLAELLLQDPERLRSLAEKGDLGGVLPVLKELPDGWSQAEIARKFGGSDDARFKAELENVRELVRKRPGIGLAP